MSLKELSEEPFVALPKGYSMRRYFDEIFGMAGVVPKVVAEGDAQFRAQLVMDHVGIILSTKLGMRAPVHQNLHFIPVSEPVYPREQAIFWRKGQQLSSAAQRFLDFMKEYYGKDARG